ncbi:MAG: pyridoxamine 5'-phosphate oxidase family protein [Clostridiaceae bacterium]
MPINWLTKDKCITLLSKAVYGSLATCGEDGQPYITPINYIIDNDKIYFHTGFKGRKLDNIRSNPKVCLEVSSSGKIYATPHAKDFTMRFWSVLVFGKASVVKDKEIKLKAMNMLMGKHAKGYDYIKLTLEDMDIVNVIEITIDDISGKSSVDPK